jgi:MATE family multidrug resistance protein
MSEARIRLERRKAWGEELRATLSLAWPLILTNLAQTAVTTTDVILMGRLGADALAAGALGTNLYFAFLIFGIGVVTATAPMLAQELGRNRHAVRELRRTVRQGFWAALAVSVPMWAVLWNAEGVLRLLGQEPALAAAAALYVRALMWAILPFLCFLVLRSFVSALERPVWSLVVSAGAVPVNAVLAYGLIFGRLGLPEVGLAGGGIATTLSSTLMLLGLAAVIVTDRRFRRYRLFGRWWRADLSRLRALWRLGLPIGATLAFEVTIFNAAAFAMGLIGAAPLAAHAVALQIASLSFMVPLGLSQAVTVRVGRAFGAGDRAGILRAGWTSYALGVGFMAAMALVLIAVPHALVGVFLDRGDPRNAGVIELAVTFLAFAALFQVADGAQAVGAGMLRGLSDTRVPMIFAALGYWGVGATLGVGLAFGTDLRGVGIWIGLATGLAVVAVLMLWRWLRRERLGLTRRPPSEGEAGAVEVGAGKPQAAVA